MPSISKTAHYKFAAATKNFLVQQHPEAVQLLQQEVAQLEQVFQKYNDHITELYAMISDYEKMQKSIRINIKKLTRQTERTMLK